MPTDDPAGVGDREVGADRVNREQLNAIGRQTVDNSRDVDALEERLDTVVKATPEP